MIGEVTTVVGVFNELPTSHWVTHPDLPTPRVVQAHVYNGEIYTVGEEIVEIYNPATQTWRSGTGNSFANERGARVGGYIYCFFSFAVWRYSIAGDVWENMSSVPPFGFNFGSFCAAGGGTDVYAFADTHVYRYSTVGNSWTTLAAWARAREDTTATVVDTFRIIVTGGSNDTNHSWVDEYVTYDDAFTAQTDSPHTHEWGMAALLGRNLYSFASRDAPVLAVDVFNVDTGTWSSTTDLPTIRVEAGCVTYGDGIFVIGGEDGGEWDGSGRSGANEELSFGPLTSMSLADTRLDEPFGLAVHPTTGVLYVAEASVGASRVRRIDLEAGTVTVIASIAVDNGDTFWGEAQRQGFRSICVSATGAVFVLVSTGRNDGITNTFLTEVWRIYDDGTHDVLFTQGTTSDPGFSLFSIAADSANNVYLMAHGGRTDEPDIYFNGVLRLLAEGDYEVYAGRWSDDYDDFPESDGPRLEAAISTSGTGSPYFHGLAVDSDDNLWVAGYRCIRKVSAAGTVTTPVGLLRHFELSDDTPIDPSFIVGAAGGPGGLRCRTDLASYGGTFVWALTTTWDTTDQHVFVYGDYAQIYHASIENDVCGPYLSGEHVIRDSTLGRHAASFSSAGVAYFGGYLYFTERYGPTIRRLTVGGAGTAAPRGLSTASTTTPRVRRT